MSNRVGAMLLALPVTAGGLALFAGREEASANSAPARWTGTDGSGVVAVYDGGECPVEVASETLTFRIPDLPFSATDGYGSTVTAEYVLRNPTEQDVDLTLFFPVGFRPDYYQTHSTIGALYSEAASYAVSCTREGVTKAADISFRHTYSSSHSYDFGDPEAEKLLPSDGYSEGRFYGKRLQVTSYSYTVTAPKGGDWFTFCFIYDCDRNKTKVLCESGVTGATGDGRGIAYAYLSPGETRKVTFYAVYTPGNQLLSANVDTKLCAGWGSEQKAEGGWVSVLTKSDQTFAEFVEDFRPARGDASDTVSEIDWYNAVVAMLLDGGSGADFLSENKPIFDNMMLWCEYDLSLAAGETLVNTVTAPLYPGFTGTDYTYEYLLSPALYWANFGDITIRVETPYHLASSSLEFTKEEGGYVFRKDSLPMCDLSFTVRAGAEAAPAYDPYENGSPVLLTALILLGVVVVAAVVIIIVAVTVHRRRQRQLSERLTRGKAREGRIDLPDGGEGSKPQGDGKQQ